MLCFLFATLIVALDQFLKHWVMRTLDVGEIGPEVIPGIMGLTRWENDGAMLNVLSGQQWLLAGIAFVAAIVLIMILLRYNEGFWGTLGLAAVLGGTVGNLVDRVFNDGKVVDMFRTLFIEFPIFNIADIFITLGFITFLIHFIALSFKAENKESSASGYDDDEYYDEEDDDSAYDEFPEIDAMVSSQAEQEVTDRSAYAPRDSQYDTRQYSEPQYTDPQYSAQEQYTPDSQYTEPQYSADQLYSTDDDVMPMSGDYEPITDSTTDTSFSLDALEMELGSLDDYNVDDLLREYGFEEDDDTLR